MNARFFATLACALAFAGCQLSDNKPKINPAVPVPPPLSPTERFEPGATVMPPPVSVSSAPPVGGAASEYVALAAHQEPALVAPDVAVDNDPLPAPSADIAAAIALEELEATALANNPAVAEASAVLQSLEGRYVQAGLGYNPSVGYMASEIGNEGHAGQQGAYVQQEFIRGNKLGLSQAVVAQEIRQAQQRLEAARLRTLTDVRIGHFDALIAQRRLEISKELSSTSLRAVDAVKSLVDAGESSKIDLLQAQIEAESAGVLVENAETAVEGAWRRLAASLGEPDRPRQRVEGELDDRAPLAEYETIVSRTIAASPQLAGAYAEIDRARWAIERARVEAVPNVTAQLAMQYDAATNDPIAGVQIGLPLPIRNRNQGGVQEAFGELRAAEHAARKLELSLERQLAQAYQDYVTARQRVDRYASEILPRASNTFDVTRSAFQNGEAGFLQLLTVQRTYFQTNLAYLDALSEMGSAGRRMNGLLLSDSLDASVRSD